MSEDKWWTTQTPCVWDGQPTTIGEVIKAYRKKAPAYVSVLARAIATAGVSNHAALVAHDLAINTRKKRGGIAAAKRKPCHFKINNKGEK